MTEASNVAPMIHVSVNNDQQEARYLHSMLDEKQKECIMTWGLNVRGSEGLGGTWDERMRLTVYGNKVKVRFLGDEGRLDRFKPRPYSGASLFRHIFSTQEKTTGSSCVCDEQ